MCVGKARRVRFRSRGRGLPSLEGKTNTQGIRFVLQPPHEGNQGWLVWGKERISALDLLARNERYLALETRGCRYNLGVKFGVVEAQVALALAGVDRERILALLLESIVRVEQNFSR